MRTRSSKLNEVHSQFREKAFPYRRLSFDLFSSTLSSSASRAGVTVEEIGKSIEQRPLKVVKFGGGRRKILMWTQMHGNESTATRAFFDWLNFISDQSNSDIRDVLQKELEIHIVPVLNPDGLVRFQRHNALGIDPNRDARKKETPEIKALFSHLEHFDPDWCFNMHDQRNLFNVKGSARPATISFLSPNTLNQDNPTNRIEVAQLIDVLNQEIQEILPGGVGRFTHEYYPRAMGDNLQTQGYRTLLIESGGAINDPERELGRKICFVAMQNAFESIASDNWKEGSLKGYEQIPLNDQKLFDLLVRGVGYKSTSGSVMSFDIGIDRVEKADQSDQGFSTEGQVRDMGDLSEHYGYETVNAEGFVLSHPLTLKGEASFEMISAKGETIQIQNGFLI